MMTLEECLFYCHDPGYEIISETFTDTLSYQERPMLESRLTLPKMRTLGSRADYIKFNSYYSNIGSRLRNKARLEMYPVAVEDYEARSGAGSPFMPHSINAGFKVGLTTAKLCSIVLDVDTFEGGAHGYTERSSQNWLVEKGERFRAKDFFKASCRWQDLIFAAIRRQAAELAGQGLLFDEWEALLRQYLDWDNFYLTRTDFVLFYPLYTIAPYSSGIIEFRISLNRLRYCIRKDFLKHGKDADDGCGCQDSDILMPVRRPPLNR